MSNFRTRVIVELIVLLFFTALHVGFYHHFSQVEAIEKLKTPPIFIELIHPKPEPIPEPKKIAPPKIVEPPKPITPPKVVKKTPKVVIKKTKPLVEQPERVVEKPKAQQESVIKVHAEEVVEKEVAQKPQQLSEPEVKKSSQKTEEKVVEAASEPEPAHEPVITKAGYGGSCKSALNRYPPDAKEQGIEGTVKIKVQVLANGNIGNVSLMKSSGSDILDNSVLEHVRDCDFEPAQKDDVPITSTVVIPVRFKLDN